MLVIRNCTFTYECPTTWDDLLATDNPRIRYCKTCDRGVYLVESDKKFRKLVKKGRCIATWCEAKSGSEENSRLVLGLVSMNED